MSLQTLTKTIPDGLDAPSDYAQLFRMYWQLAKSRVARHPGIPGSEVEDVAMSILTRFIERDFLSQYAPVKEYVSKAGQIKVRTQTFVSFFIVFMDTYVYHYTEKAQLLRRREVQVIDAEGGMEALSAFLPSWDGDLDALIEQDYLGPLFERVAARAAKAGLSATLRVLVSQVLLDQRIFLGRMASELGVKTAVVKDSLETIKAIIKDELEYLPCSARN